jgi:hypothetical protein
MGKRFRPFSEAAKVRCRGYSKLLRRIISDFGADHAFGQVPKKLKEHYGISVPISAVRDITEHHAEEIDGSMVPIVEEDQEGLKVKGDRRKAKRCIYCEARLSLAREQRTITPIFAGTFGSVDKAGKQLLHCVEMVGIGKKTKVHCVGDGAQWIANQVEDKFGTNGNYLIDFYHLCEYLSAAAPTCAPGQEKRWLEIQKEQLKDNHAQAVLMELSNYLERQGDKESPVKDCHRYIQNRLHQLDYKTAIERNLPIGSGEIESAHRYIIQKRLKTTGTWWKKINAEYMLAMRICRANEEWDNYWNMAA